MLVENSKMIYRGSGELARVYRGQTIVWEPKSPHLRSEVYYNTSDGNYLPISAFFSGSTHGSRFRMERSHYVDTPLAFVAELTDDMAHYGIYYEWNASNVSGLTRLDFGYSIVMPDIAVYTGYTSVGNGAAEFYHDNPDLESVQFETRIAEIKKCFKNCPKLKNIYLYGAANYRELVPDQETIDNLPAGGSIYILQSDRSYIYSSKWNQLVQNKGWEYQIL